MWLNERERFSVWTGPRKRETTLELNMSLLNMTICTHLLIILVTLGNITFIRSYHISVEPQPTLKYNGHIVSSKIWLFVSIWLLLVFWIHRFHLPDGHFSFSFFRLTHNFNYDQLQTVNKLLPKVKHIEKCGEHKAQPNRMVHFHFSLFYLSPLAISHSWVLSMAFPFQSQFLFITVSIFFSRPPSLSFGYNAAIAHTSITHLQPSDPKSSWMLVQAL